MLVDLMSEKPITRVPYAGDYQRYLSRMTPTEIDAIRDALNAKIDGTEIQTSSWMPGADWTGTPYQAIYEKAARFNEELAAKCFGLMVWDVFMRRPERWTSGRFEKDGEPISGRTYFRVQ
jgi:hypothetical protein